MSRLEEFYCKMDLMVKYIATKEISEKTTYPIISSSLYIGTITCCGELVTSRIQHTLFNKILHAQFKNWYTKHFNIPHDLIKTELLWKTFQSTRKECKCGLVMAILQQVGL